MEGSQLLGRGPVAPCAHRCSRLHRAGWGPVGVSPVCKWGLFRWQMTESEPKVTPARKTLWLTPGGLRAAGLRQGVPALSRVMVAHSWALPAVVDPQAGSRAGGEAGPWKNHPNSSDPATQTGARPPPSCTPGCHWWSSHRCSVLPTAGGREISTYWNGTRCHRVL